jgi:hypothetical protein
MDTVIATKTRGSLTYKAYFVHRYYRHCELVGKQHIFSIILMKVEPLASFLVQALPKFLHDIVTLFVYDGHEVSRTLPGSVGGEPFTNDNGNKRFTKSNGRHL